MSKTLRRIDPLNVLVALIFLAVAIVAYINIVAYLDYKSSYDAACAVYESQTCVNFLFPEK